MRIYNFIILLFSIFLFSCQSKRYSDVVPECRLQHEILLNDDFVIGKVRSMALMDDSIPMVTEVQSEHVFRMLDYMKQSIRGYGERGQGPDDFLFPAVLVSRENHLISFWDVNKKRYSTIQIEPTDSVAHFNHLFTVDDSLFHFEVYPVCDGQFVASGIYDEYRLVLLDQTGHLKKGFGQCPYRDKEESKVSGRIRSEVYQGKLAANGSGTRLTHALLHADILSFYEVTHTDSLHLIAEEIKAYPDYQYDNAVLEKSALIYYLDVCATDQYVYALYSGRNYEGFRDKAFLGNIIKVYDWNGAWVKNLILDIDVQNIRVTKNDNRLYAIAYSPNPVLVSFSLS